MLLCFLLLALTGLGSTSPTGLLTNSHDLQSRTIHEDELHARTLSNHPKDLIIDSKDLDDYIKKHPDSDAIVYLKDKQSFVPMSSVSVLEENSETEGNGKEKRQYSSPCYVYNQWQARDASSAWGPWEPASGCLYTGLSEGSGTRTISWSKSVSVEVSGGLDWNPIKDVLGVSLGIAVTNTWTDGGKIDCNIPAGSVGQIWAQKYIGEAKMWKRMCQSCGASGRKCLGDWEEAGFVKAPSDGSDPSKNLNTGCSTGNNDVKC
ncbi:hypothetical protein F53441_10381 [Fusarium austroafricanum]|uniref:Uncharacterized protein n=1 Tax=Fusarium austroafricanum TaxID=2364996 RepID=A0A8H4K8Z7_9HYPO|nr:hypothetical protein F53441_10381 [Fusarium austroafricanum]